MGIQFKKGVLELCIFYLVAKSELYAYELVKLLSSQFRISEGALYPLIRQLTQSGFLETYVKEVADGSTKKFYRLTELGIEAKCTYRLEWVDLTKRVNNLIEEDDQHE